MTGARRAALLTSALLALAACGADTGAGTTAPVVPDVSHAWALDGDGAPSEGGIPLTFSGQHELAAEAVSFDGASGSGQSTAPGPVTTTDDFSVAAWVSFSPSGLPGAGRFATAVSQLGDEAAAFYLGVADGVWAFTMKDADTNAPGHSTRAVSAVATPDDSAWVHLVGVHDADDDRLRFYVDGEPAGGADFSGGWQAEGPLTVGRAQAHGAAADYWPGAVADVRIFASPLTDSEVRELADTTAPGAAPPPRPSSATTALPNGTYEYTFTPEEAAEVMSVGFSPEEAADAGYPGRVSVSLRFEDGQWQLFFTVDGVVYEVDGQPEGDGGTYQVSGDRLVLTNPDGDVVYGWTTDGQVLSLTVLELSHPEEAAVVRLVTEHDYTRVPGG